MKCAHRWRDGFIIWYESDVLILARNRWNRLEGHCPLLVFVLPSNVSYVLSNRSSGVHHWNIFTMSSCEWRKSLVRVHRNVVMWIIIEMVITHCQCVPTKTIMNGQSFLSSSTSSSSSYIERRSLLFYNCFNPFTHTWRNRSSIFNWIFSFVLVIGYYFFNL